MVIGRDPKILNPDSENFRRVREYADLFEETHIILMMSGNFEPRSFGNKLFLWPTNSSFLWQAPYDAWRLGKKIAARYNPELIDAQDASESGLAAFLIARKCGLPFRIQIHTDIMSPFFKGASFKERLRYCLARFLIPRANCIRVVSERIKKSLLSSFPAIEDKSITVLPIFSDLNPYLTAKADYKTQERFRSYNFKMISAGRLVEKEKNLSLLIKMMREFIKSAPQSLLVIVGEGPGEKNYKSQIANYKLQKNVIIEPWKEDLFSFYKSFDLFLLSSNYEGWGRIVLEAMAAGLPAVMTDVGLAGEIVKNKENGLVVPVADQKAFFQAVLMSYRDKELRKKLAQNARDTALKLSLQTKADYLSLYKKAILLCRKQPF